LTFPHSLGGTEPHGLNPSHPPDEPPTDFLFCTSATQRQALAAGGGFGRQKPKVENAQRGRIPSGGANAPARPPARDVVPLFEYKDN